MTYPAEPESQGHTQGSPHPFISHANFGLGDDIENFDRNLSGYENVERIYPLDNVSDLECRNEKVVLVRSIRTKDAD